MMPLYPSNSVVNNQIINDLTKVQGMTGARNYPTRPNTRDVVFDGSDDICYFRITDSNNAITEIRRCRFVDEPEPAPEDIFVTKESFNELKGEITDVKQSIQQLLAAIGTNDEQHIKSTKSNNRQNGKPKKQYEPSYFSVESSESESKS